MLASDDPAFRVTSQGIAGYIKDFMTFEHIFLYLFSLLIAGAISFGTALLYARVMVKHDIPVHRGYLFNTMIVTFSSYLYVLVLVMIQNTPVGASAYGLPIQTVRWQVTFCLVGQSIGISILFSCWLVLLKLYKRYERLQSDKMQKRLFGWTKDETAANWALSEAQKSLPRAMEEGLAKKA